MDFKTAIARAKPGSNPKGYKMSVSLIKIPLTKNRNPVYAKRLLKRTEWKNRHKMMQVYKGTKMKDLLQKLGKKTLVQMAEMPRNHWQKHLENETYVRNGKVKHYAAGTIENKHQAMDAITMRGKLSEGLLDVYRDSLRVPIGIRKQAGEIYKKLHPNAILPPMKLSKSEQKKAETEKFLNSIIQKNKF